MSDIHAELDALAAELEALREELAELNAKLRATAEGEVLP